jgi:Response regulator containing CheY-like receiver, AAA-type ATPase, and DNA-binding domains
MADDNNETASVLVVDDEAAIRYSVSKTLQRVGYHVREAASGEDALDVMRAQNFDVVLTDVRMPPGLDGVELVRRIKDTDPDMVVILMTAYPSLGTAVEALRLGAHDYLIKPSSSQDIRQSVAAASSVRVISNVGACCSIRFGIMCRNYRALQKNSRSSIAAMK